MPSLTSLRFAFCCTSCMLVPRATSTRIFPRPPSLQLTATFSSLSKKRHLRRKFATERDPQNIEKTLKMEDEDTESMGFNKRRAEGMERRQPKTLQLKTRKLNPVNTTCYVQILGTGMDTQDTCPSILLFFDKQRFIFNAGEGLQRFCTEHRIKLSKIDHIFLSRVCSETAGGLPGLLLTMANIGDQGMSVNMWGPSDLKYLLDAMRMFIPNAAMVHSNSFGAAHSTISSLFSDPIVLVDDEVIKISAIILYPDLPKNHENVNRVDPSEVFAAVSEIDDLPDPPLSPPRSPRTSGMVPKPGDMAVVYVCELPEIKGKFDPAKAVALGLKAGPKYRELQLGHSVKSDRKNIMVHPSDVLGPSIPGPIIVLVDCPTPSHAQGLFSVPSLSEYFVDSVGSSGTHCKTVNCVIHLGPGSVTTTEDYKKWMSRFGEVHHIMAGHEMRNVEIPVLKSNARVSSRLNYVCPRLFPSTGFWTVEKLGGNPLYSIPSAEEVQLMHTPCVYAKNLMKFHLRPYANLGLDESGVPIFTKPSDIINELLSEIPEIKDASMKVKRLWENLEDTKCESILNNSFPVEEPWMKDDMVGKGSQGHETSLEDIQSRKGILPPNGQQTLDGELETHIPGCLENVSREDMEIVFLGTGSSQPSKYRNVSSIYINLFARGGILLDCGEGTLGQLRRRFGIKGADDAVKSLKFIWISHIHADHHTGIARILAHRARLLKDEPHDPLLVIGPRQLKRFIDAYCRLEKLNLRFLDCRYTMEVSKEVSEQPLKAAMAQNNMQQHNVMDKNGSTSSESSGVGNTSQMLGATLFAKGGMESFWKKSYFLGEASIDTFGLNKLKNTLKSSGLESLASVPVVHCPQAYGLVLQAADRVNSVGKVIDGWKLVYSGDTRPCQALIDASYGATVLIHEATFDDSLVDEAIARNHSTTTEAVEVGSSVGAYRIILTHFSQRYPKIPVFDDTHMNTCIGFDMMSVNLADLVILPKVTPYLKLLFRNEMISDQAEEQLAVES